MRPRKPKTNFLTDAPNNAIVTETVKMIAREDFSKMVKSQKEVAK